MLTRVLALYFIATGLYASVESNATRLKKIDKLERFAFGSCNSPYNDQPLWEWINKDEPQLWIWGGDNIYAETEESALVRQTYEMQNKVEGYNELKQKTPIIGIISHQYAIDVEFHSVFS